MLESELCAHTQALRNLARLLVGDGAADDLLQDTALVALGSPPAEISGLRGWLSQVLRRLARNHKRGEVRRQRRERQLAPRAPEDPAARVAEHHEAVHRMTAALLALPEPYHSTLLLRFFEELTPTVIAEQAGVPLATVKSRLQRGLKLLRERLDEESKSEDWRPALAVIFGIPHVDKASAAAIVPVTAATTGILAMASTAKLSISVVAASVALGGCVAIFYLSGAFGPKEPNEAESHTDVVATPLRAPDTARPAESHPAAGNADTPKANETQPKGAPDADGYTRENPEPRLFPRNDFSFQRLLESDPGRLEKLVWRNESLNPRDHEIAFSDPEWTRMTLQPVLDSLSTYRRLQSERSKVQWKEMAVTAESGRISKMQIDPDPENATLKKAKKMFQSEYPDDPARAVEMYEKFAALAPKLWKSAQEVDVIYHRADGFYGARYQDLPATAAILSQEIEARNQAAAALVGLFLAHGTLSDAEAAALLSQAWEMPPAQL